LNNIRFQQEALLTPRSEVIDSGTVIVKFGAEEKKYTVHKRLLAYHSGYIRQELASRFQSHSVMLLPQDEITVGAFDVFVDWMYEKTLPLRITFPRQDQLKVQTYVLAEILSVSRMKAAMMDVIYSVVRGSSFDIEATIYLFKHLPVNDPMLQLVVDTFCVNKVVYFLSADKADEINQLPKEFLIRALRKFQQLSQLPEDEKKLKREDYLVV
jgi:hypothetical protein